MNPVTVANQISGERSTESVVYPVTGNPELDLISGINAVIERHGPKTQPTFFLPAECWGSRVVRCLEFILGGWKAELALRTLPSAAMGGGINKQPIEPSYTPYTPTDGTQWQLTTPWMTFPNSSGTTASAKTPSSGPPPAEP